MSLLDSYSDSNEGRINIPGRRNRRNPNFNVKSIKNVSNLLKQARNNSDNSDSIKISSRSIRF